MFFLCVSLAFLLIIKIVTLTIEHFAVVEKWRGTETNWLLCVSENVAAGIRCVFLTYFYVLFSLHGWNQSMCRYSVICILLFVTFSINAFLLTALIWGIPWFAEPFIFLLLCICVVSRFCLFCYCKYLALGNNTVILKYDLMWLRELKVHCPYLWSSSHLGPRLWLKCSQSWCRGRGSLLWHFRTVQQVSRSGLCHGGWSGARWPATPSRRCPCQGCWCTRLLQSTWTGHDVTIHHASMDSDTYSLL